MPGIIPKSVARAGLYQVCDNSILTRYRQSAGMGELRYDVDEFGNLITVEIDPPPPGTMQTSESCSPNVSYPAGHKCARVQVIVDAGEVIRTTLPGGLPPAALTPPGTGTAPGVDIARWLSANSTLVAWGIAGIIGLKLLTARR